MGSGSESRDQPQVTLTLALPLTLILALPLPLPLTLTLTLIRGAGPHPCALQAVCVRDRAEPRGRRATARAQLPWRSGTGISYGCCQSRTDAAPRRRDAAPRREAVACALSSLCTLSPAKAAVGRTWRCVLLGRRERGRACTRWRVHSLGRVHSLACAESVPLAVRVSRAADKMLFG